MRRSEKDFMLRVDAKYVGRLEKGLAHYMKVVNDYVEIAEDKKSLTGLGNIYFADFKKVSTSLLAEGKDRKFLSKIFGPINPQLKALQEKASGQFDAANEDLRTSAATTFIAIIAAMLVSAAISATLGFVIVRMLSTPLVSMTSAMAELADGKLDTEVPAGDFSNEVGEMAEAVETFKQNAIAALKLAGDAKVEQATREKRARQIVALCDEFDKSVSVALDSVTTSSTQTEATAQGMTSMAEQAGARSQTVATASEQASGNVQTVRMRGNAMMKIDRFRGYWAGYAAPPTRLAASAIAPARPGPRGP